MKYINGIEAKIGDKVVIVSSESVLMFYPCLVTGEVLSVSNADTVVVKDVKGHVSTKLYNQVYPI